MPSDTPTPAEIAGAHLSYPWAGGSGCDCGAEFANARDHGAHVVAALSEHYHLLPRVEAQGPDVMTGDYAIPVENAPADRRTTHTSASRWISGAKR
ncbi:hypothetical protein SEA_ODAY_83 [Gordonia phage ODay]|nr:hypothetical protein SEA_ODAY_83 [Gordonia phage ODay]